MASRRVFLEKKLLWIIDMKDTDNCCRSKEEEVHEPSLLLNRTSRSREKTEGMIGHNLWWRFPLFDLLRDVQFSIVRQRVLLSFYLARSAEDQSYFTARTINNKVPGTRTEVIKHVKWLIQARSWVIKMIKWASSSSKGLLFLLENALPIRVGTSCP